MLEYCPGIKINDAPALDAKGLDRQRLARLAVESYLQQILNHGFFHAGRVAFSLLLFVRVCMSSAVVALEYVLVHCVHMFMCQPYMSDARKGWMELLMRA